MAVVVVNENRGTMRIAVALFGDEVSPRFDCCTGLLVQDADGSEVRLDLCGRTAHARIQEVVRQKPDCLLCGGIRRCDLFFLTETGIQVIDGLSGEARVAVDACRNDALNQETENQIP